MQNLRSLFATPKYLGAFLSRPSTLIRCLSLFPKIPPSIIVQHQTIPTKTPEHHNNAEVERLLKTQLCGFPPYEARKRWFFYLLHPNLAV
ncbi:mitochondrial 28S ribosomal protein S14 [Clonorchis sinensis]|uniref:Mitochondrial 28S ribosomal protein S14 n=1 Tax=Clonorchis sinensis TaxID=79923 RepID=G7YG72_CLOSI|nr:mitochondrial 28S ribosomal protein S14 [Clonorchis sinensis]